MVTVHGLEALKMRAILDVSEPKCSSNWTRSAEKPHFYADFATFARERLRKLFLAKKTIPGSLLFIQTVVGVMLGGKPVISNYGLLSLMKFGSVLPRDALLLDRFNDVMHRQWAE
jgi:hypothetical protein